MITYFPLLRHGLHRKRRLQQFFVAGGTSLPSCYLATIGGYRDRSTDTRVQTIILLLRLVTVAGTYLPNRCLATKGRLHFTEPLPSFRTAYETLTVNISEAEYAKFIFLGESHRRSLLFQEKCSSSVIG
jgi:hypothetical protein